MSDPRIVYSQATMGRDEPDTILMTAGHARTHFNAFIDSDIADDVMLIFTKEGYGRYE